MALFFVPDRDTPEKVVGAGLTEVVFGATQTFFGFYKNCIVSQYFSLRVYFCFAGKEIFGEGEGGVQLYIGKGMRVIVTELLLLFLKREREGLNIMGTNRYLLSHAHTPFPRDISFPPDLSSVLSLVRDGRRCCRLVYKLFVHTSFGVRGRRTRDNCDAAPVSSCFSPLP